MASARQEIGPRDGFVSRADEIQERIPSGAVVAQIAPCERFAAPRWLDGRTSSEVL
jgi:hypothetical protein